MNRKLVLLKAMDFYSDMIPGEERLMKLDYLDGMSASEYSDIFLPAIEKFCFRADEASNRWVRKNEYGDESTKFSLKNPKLQVWTKVNSKVLPEKVFQVLVREGVLVDRIGPDLWIYKNGTMKNTFHLIQEHKAIAVPWQGMTYREILIEAYKESLED